MKKHSDLLFLLAFVILTANIHRVNCEIPSEVEDELATMLEIYGRCWFDVMQVVKSQCKSQTAPDAVGRSTLLMYNCFLEKFEARRIVCPTNEDVKFCEALNREIRKDFNRQVYLEFRNLYSVFCYHWTSSGFPRVFEFFDDSVPQKSVLETVSSFVGWIVEACLVTWRQFCQFVVEMTWTKESQLQVHFYPAYNHGLIALSRYFASTEVFIRDTWKKWKLFTEMMFTDVRKCQGVKNSRHVNMVGNFAWLESCLVFGSNLNVARIFSNLKPYGEVDLFLSLIVTIEFCIEIQIILFSLNNCPGAGLQRDAFDFMQNKLATVRFIGSALSIGLMAIVFFICFKQESRIEKEIEENRVKIRYLLTKKQD